MIANQDYDLSRPLASALKAKAPFVGLPMPGHAPLIFKREILQRALKGVKVLYIEVELVEGSNRRMLVVEGSAGPRVRTRCKFVAIERHQLYGGGCNRSIWQEFQRWTAKSIKSKIVEMPAPRGMKTKLATVAKLERELAKMGDLKRIANPCIPYDRRYATTNEHHTRTIMEWQQQRRLRTVIGAISRGHSSFTTTSTKLYEKLRELGVTVTKYSDMTPTQRERKGVKCFSDYTAKLWKFCNLQSKPLEYGHPHKPDSDMDWDKTRTKTWGPERYYPYLSELNQRRSLQAQIDSIRELAQAA